MQIEHIKEFLSLSETLNFGETSKRMFITQSALSRHISSMEDEINIKLFERKPSGVELTRAGFAFAKHARKIISSYEIALREANAAKDGAQKTLHIGYLFDAMRYILPTITKALKQASDIEVYYSTLEYGSLMAELRKKRVDVALTLDLNLGYMDDIAFVPIERDHYALVVPKNHPLASKESVSLAEIRQERVITPNPEIMGKRLHNFFCSVVSERGVYSFIEETHYSDIPSLAYQVESGEGVSLMFTHHEKRYGDTLQFIPISNEIPTVEFAFAWLKETESEEESWPKSLRALAEKIREQQPNYRPCA